VGTQENQVVNILEFLTALILLAQFGDSSPSDLVYNSELVEHKINLMLLLFDFRQQNSMNISEIIIMLQTAIQSMQKIYPESVLFRKETITDEIKLSMMNMFGDTLERGVLEQFGEVKKQQVQNQMANEGFTDILMKKKSGFGSASSASSNLMKLGSMHSQPAGGDDLVKSPIQGAVKEDTDLVHQQQHIHESLEEKKRRLFKWAYYEKIMLDLTKIKE
jgi:hypothetical protein